MKSRTWVRAGILAAAATAAAWAGTFGKVVSIGGHASDLALDEARGVLYVSNFTANRVEVISLAGQSVRTSINVPAQPSSVALSPDGRYLLIAHYGNFANSPSNALTVIELDSGARQTYALASPPLGVAFGIDGMALVATSADFLRFDPESGTSEVIDSIAALTMKTLPQPAPSFPPQITAASVAASRDGKFIFAMTDTIRVGYDVLNRRLQVGKYIASPPMGPRVVSVAEDASTVTAGWALWEGREGFGSHFRLMSQFPDPSGDLHIGSHVIDSLRSVIYAQVPSGLAAGASNGSTTAAPPVLQVVDGDNLAVLERLNLPENLAGKGVISRDFNTVYVISDSGVIILPVGALERQPRVKASVTDVVFRGSFCDRRATTLEFDLADQSGGNTDFVLKSSHSAIRVSPEFGTTPARIKVTVDPAAFQGQNGTLSHSIAITSKGAINIPDAVRVLINTREPDQRGMFYALPGKLVDILPDPARDRFYVLRQDTNRVIVYEASTYTEIASLKTGNTPTQLAMSFDGKYLMIGANNSQVLYWYDLDTLQRQPLLYMPSGHYPKSIAASSSTILVASRVSGPKHGIDRIDLSSGTISELPSLGIFDNDVALNTSLVASPNGNSILVAQENGKLMLFNANANTFTVARKDQEKLTGAIAASNYDQYVVGDSLLNSSLVPIRKLDNAGSSSGFAFLADGAFRMTSPGANSAGVLQRVNLTTGDGWRPTRTVESPLLPDPLNYTNFTRTLAPLPNRGALVALTTSGFTVFPWDYDAATAPPKISAVVNAADGTPAVAPGGLITVYGTNLSPVTQASSQTPLPTILGESCMTVNGVPVPVIYVSGRQINAQLPLATGGSTTLILRTPGGVSDNYNLTVQSTAPGVFRSTVNEMPVGSIVRATNGQLVTPSNPVHRGDLLSIYATGLGATSPAVPDGYPGPFSPLAEVLAPPSVTLGGVPVEVKYAGLAPGQVGVYQINVSVGIGVPTGWNVPLEISQGANVSTFNVRVVQ